MPGAPEMAWQGGSQRVPVQGRQRGRWKGVLREDQLARYADKIAAEFTPALAVWLEHGRLVAGDPATAAD